MSEFKSKFNERLNILKEESGLNVLELSKELDMHSSTLANYFKDREPKYDVLMKIANRFNVSVDWLVGYSDFRGSVKNTTIEPKEADPSGHHESEQDEADDIFLLGEELEADVSSKTLRLLLQMYPDNQEFITETAKGLGKINETFFPNSDTNFGKIYDDTYLMSMIQNVFSKYIACVVNYSEEAALPIGVFGKNDILGILQDFTILTETFHELMVNYNYHLATSIAENKSPLKVQKIVNDVTEFFMTRFHEQHPVTKTVENYNKLFEPDFLG